MKPNMPADKTLYVKRISDGRLEEVVQNTLINMNEGRVLQLITDNRNARRLIPVLCHNLGCSLISSWENVEGMRFLIRK